jgi:hypothetical protein
MAFNIYGSDFRRVSLQNNPRRGLLGQGSFLTVTAQRLLGITGWILENLMGSPPLPRQRTAIAGKRECGAWPPWPRRYENA